MFVTAENTPNPNAMKFLCSRPISPSTAKTFLSASECESSPLAQKLFMIEGVEVVFFGSNFITLSKFKESSWELIKSRAILTIVDHFSLTNEIFTNKELGQSTQSTPLEDAVERQIKQVLEEYVRPAIAMDGGDLIYHGFKNGTVTLTLIGACKGCPSSEFTLTQGIQRTLQYHVPEVLTVEVAPEEQS
jgi:Fe-S cluster biogenesis protein NfuA